MVTVTMEATDTREAVLKLAASHGLRLMEGTCEDDLLAELRRRMRARGLVVQVVPFEGVKAEEARA
jgi:hypothetical protein